TPVNDPPTANNDSRTVAEDSGATVIAVLTNDSILPDSGETLSILSVNTTGTQGSVAITGGGTGLTFAPAANFFGTTTFTYTIGDGTPGSTSTATVTMTITGTNDPPTAASDSDVIPELAGATIVDVLANDSGSPDLGESLSVVAVTQPSHGSSSITAGI